MKYTSFVPKQTLEGWGILEYLLLITIVISHFINMIESLKSQQKWRDNMEENNENKNSLTRCSLQLI